MNAEVPAGPLRRLLKGSLARAAHTCLTATRHRGTIDTVADAGLKCWADTAYQGVGRPIRVRRRGRRLKRWQCRHHTAHARSAVAAKARCRTNCITWSSKLRFPPSRVIVLEGKPPPARQSVRRKDCIAIEPLAAT
jgi:hypothetical protein